MQWLTLSYLRRKQFENRALAVALLNALGESSGAGGAARVPASAMVAMMGGFS
jgi:hypothetical protein